MKMRVTIPLVVEKVYMGELYAEEGDMEYPDEDNFDSDEEYDELTLL